MNSAVVWIAAAAGLGCAVLVVLVAGDVHAPLGDTDPGLVTTVLAAVVRFAATVAGLLAAGALAFAALVVPRRAREESLTADAYAATRTAGTAATAWAVAAVAMVPLSAADATGQPLGEVWAVLPGLVDATEEPKAWLAVAFAAVVVTVGARATLRWPPLVLWLAVAAAGLVAPVVAGHVAAGEWHDVATNAMVWHVLAAAVWTGALVSLWSFLRRPTARERGRVLRRYRALTLGCLVVLVVSGAVTGLALARPTGLVGGYGVLLALKLVVCGLVLALRRWCGARWPVAVELVVLGVAVGATVGLTHLVPPAFLSDPSTIVETLLGYELPTAPTVAALLTAWRFDLLFGTAAVAAVLWYLRAVRVLRRRGDRWPVGRTVAWVAGCLVVLVVTSSGVGRFAPGTFSTHMVVHMALNMLAPALLVQGGPVTLALRTLRPAPRQWLVSLPHSRVARVLTHPALATVVFAGSSYALYLTPLFGAAMPFHWAHQLMNLHLLVSGYVFSWLVAGVDRPPRPLVHPARLGMLFAVMPFHAFFGVLLMNTSTVIAETYYRYLSLPWVPDLLADQRLGGGIAWAAGELPVVLLLVALLRQWAAADQRAAERADRRPDRLAAYDAVLADLAGHRHDEEHTAR